MKLSPWHDGSVKPSDIGSPPGVYQVQSSLYCGIAWSYWDGAIFNGAWYTKSKAKKEFDFGRGCDIFQWRGILK